MGLATPAGFEPATGVLETPALTAELWGHRHCTTHRAVGPVRRNPFVRPAPRCAPCGPVQVSAAGATSVAGARLLVATRVDGSTITLT